MQNVRELANQLEPPTYQNLVGVEGHLTSLSEVLVSEEPPWIVSICGIGGIGKTSLADALFRRLIRQGLFEEFGWVSAKRGDLSKSPALSVGTLVEELVEQLLGFTPAQLFGQQAFQALRYHLKQKPYLIVIDNLETVIDIESLLPTLRDFANPSKFVLTSRQSLFDEPNLYHYQVPPLDQSNTLQLIRQEAKQRHLPNLLKASDELLRPIYDTVGGNPLALRLLVGQSHIHPLSLILEDLMEARGESPENVYLYLYRRAWDNLDEPTRRLFVVMPLVPECGGLLSFIAHLTELSPASLRHCMNLLVTLNLVDVRHDLSASRYSIHHLTRTFLHKEIIKWP